MRILYIFPHPDDESFGPAAAIHQQLSQGHNVFLLTLTKGGATKQRFELGLSIHDMGEIRYKEMLQVQKTLKLSGMTVLDFPDNGLCELDPRELERAVARQIREIKPDVVVTYAVHGISGFHDHLVAHAVVKRVFVELKDQDAGFLKRLALLTLPDNGESVWRTDGSIRLKMSMRERIDCELNLSDSDVDTMKSSLECYETYKGTIAESGVVEKIGNTLYFEFFKEDYNPPLSDLTAKL